MCGRHSAQEGGHVEPVVVGLVEIGRLRLDAIHTPGHTPGSISFRLRDTPLLFTGDTLFPGGPGNTSFEGARLAGKVMRTIVGGETVFEHKD